jgi:2,4-dienoyl-CoA reductase-like NADH-dependent reductase (Old Yellow Enzyme family)
MTSLGNPLHFNNGSTIKNRFMLAALTNLQSGTDGVMSDDEYHWLTRRAEGGFGLTMTCAYIGATSGCWLPWSAGRTR